MEEKIKKIMSRLFGMGINEISEKTAFNSVKKWDSLKHMELIIALEKEFKIKFDSYEIPTMINFKIISATISSHIESK